MRTIVLLAVGSLASACGAGASATTTTTTETVTVTETETVATAAPATADARESAIELHEWGLVDVDLARGSGELSAGPGQPARPVVARKPVIYAHLLGDVASAALTVSVRVHGTLLEQWPIGEATPSTILWDAQVRRGVCEATRGPIRDLPARACASADGYCEVPELPRYVTDDHDCMTVAGEDAPLLFYRAQVSPDALPLRVTRAADLGVRIEGVEGAWNGPRAIVRISQGLGGPAAPATIARAEIGAAATTIAVGTEALDATVERAALERALTVELGLTASEARVFLEAWSTELFGDPATARESVRSRRWVAPQRDEILYWLPADRIDALAELTGSIPIRTRRAFLVRVALGPVATAGPAR